MSALPRPDLGPGPHRELNDALHDLHHSAGWPSLRSLAGQAGCSHTTVSHAFSSDRLPSWGLLELLVEAMDGDVAHFHELWLRASGQDTDGGEGRDEGPVDTARPPPVRIAGRRDELDAVRRHLASGTGLLLVSGEAGIGKTRLVTAAAGLADGCFVALGSCLPLSTQVPLLPVTDALRTVHHVDGGRWLADALAACPGYVTASLSRQLPEIVPVETVHDPADDWARQRMFTAVRTTLAALAEQRPFALVLEDLHWADVTTLDLLEHLLTRGFPVPLVGTRRTDDAEAMPGTTDWVTRVRRTASVQELELGPLSRAGTAEQLELLLGEAPDEDLVERIHRRTLGHPFFTEQLATGAEGDAAGLPRLLAELLDRRLDGLPLASWQVARALGVAGRGLPEEVLREATALDDTSYREAVRGLAERHLVTASDGPGRVGLRHPLLGEAVRHRLVPGEAGVVHRSLAGALSRGPEPSAAEVAAHWQGAGDAEHELGWRLEAAQATAERFAGALAATHWTRVLEIWPAGATTVSSPRDGRPITRPQAWFSALDGCDLVGRVDRGRELADRALAECGGWEDTDRAVLYRRASSYFLAEPADRAEGTRLLEESVELLRGLPPSESLIRALDQLATLRNRTARPQAAAELIDEAACVLDRMGDVPVRRSLLTSMAWQDSVTGRLGEALDRFREIGAMVPPEPEPERDIYLAVMHTDVLLKACRPAAEVEAAAEPGLRAIREWGIDSLRSQVLRANVALAWLRAGRPRRADEVLAGSLVSVGGPPAWGVHLVQGRVDCTLGRAEEARERYAELATQRPAEAGLLAPVLTELEFWQGGAEDAFGWMRHALESIPGLLIPGETGEALLLAARAAAELAERSPQHGSPAGRRELAAQALDLLRRMPHDPFGTAAVPADRHAGPQWRAELTRLAGTQTVDCWQQAAAAWAAVDRPHDAAYCTWRAAQVALDEAQPALADALLRRALLDAHQHGPLTDRIRTLAGAP